MADAPVETTPVASAEVGTAVAAAEAPGGPVAQAVRAAPAAAPPVPTVASDLDVPGVIKQRYDLMGMNSAGNRFADGSRRFIEWLYDSRLTLGTMPNNAVETYLSHFANPITRNLNATAVRVLAETCAAIGHPFIAQPITRVPVKRRSLQAPTVAQAGAAPAAPGVAPVVSSQPVETVTMRPAAASAVAAPGPLTQVRPASPTRPRTALPGLGGRIRVSKRVDGSEGIPAPIGSRVLVGEYHQQDLEGEDSIARFIASFIRPRYGPFRNGRPSLYIVERLDNLGNPIPGGAIDVPIMPGEDLPPGEAGAAAPASTAQVLPVQPPPLSVNDRVLGYIMERERVANDRYEALLKELREQKEKGGIDAATFMLLAERYKPEKIDVSSILRDAQPTAALPGTLLSPAGESFFPTTRTDPIEKLTSLVERLADRIQATPPPGPAVPDPVAQLTALATAFRALVPAPAPPPPPPPPNPILDKLAEITIKQMAEPPKTKTLAETLGDLRAIQGFMSQGNAPPSVPEVLMEVINNADKVGDLIARMRGVPVLPAPPPPAGVKKTTAGAAGAAPAKKPAPPLPDAAKQAFVGLRDAREGEDQRIVTHLWDLLTALSGGPEPWPLVTKRTIEAVIGADSKPELRSIITQLFVWCGAKGFLDEALLEKLTSTIHRHYGIIHAQLTGGQAKTLRDAPAPSAPEREGAEEEPSEVSDPDSGAGAEGAGVPAEVETISHALAAGAERRQAEGMRPSGPNGVQREGEEEDEGEEEAGEEPQATS